MKKSKLTPNDAPGASTQVPPVPDALRNFDQLPDSAEVRIRVVNALYACSSATTYRRVKAGIIPKPRKRGGIASWVVGELRQSKAG